MAHKPVHVFVDRQELIGYTDLTLKRSKSDMTGELSITVFMGWLPTDPVLDGVVVDKEVLVYIGGHLAFTGKIDSRADNGDKGQGSTATATGGSGSLNIGPDSYTVKFTCRGKTSDLVDCSHQHATGTMLNPTNREVFETLVEPWGYEIDWQADELALDRIRFRDGGRVVDELQRVAEMCGLYVFETRHGVIRVTDSPSTVTGEAVALGTNILTFSTNQSGNHERSEVVVKGQRTDKATWGESAVLPTLKRIANSSVPNFRPLTVQVYGNATPEIIDKRIDYEMNKRATAAKKVQLDVFHILQTDGTPWDIGDVHYVEIPPAGVFANMEITELTYHVSNNKTLKTSLTFGPTQIKTATAATANGFLSGLSELVDGFGTRSGRAQRFGATELSNAWLGPVLAPVAAVVDTIQDALTSSTTQSDRPPSTLPQSFRGGEQ